MTKKQEALARTMRLYEVMTEHMGKNISFVHLYFLSAIASGANTSKELMEIFGKDDNGRNAIRRSKSFLGELGFVTSIKKEYTEFTLTDKANALLKDVEKAMS